MRACSIIFCTKEYIYRQMDPLLMLSKLLFFFLLSFPFLSFTLMMAAHHPHLHQHSHHLAHAALDPIPTAPPTANPAVEAHRRGYQACDPCRRRKVKCDLGSMLFTSISFFFFFFFLSFSILLLKKTGQVSIILDLRHASDVVAKAKDANSLQHGASENSRELIAIPNNSTMFSVAISA